MKQKRRSWLLLILTLPTGNATARMRIWRTLKAMGCGVLRDGVYVLPAGESHRSAFAEIADAVVDAGGAAYVIDTVSRDDAQEELLSSLFDRSAEFSEFIQSLTAARKTLSKRPLAEVNRLVRRLQRDYESLRASDFFPSEATLRAEAAWTDFVGAVDTIMSPGEPHAEQRVVRRLQRKDYQGRLWATRRHLWVDRVASAWLIRRFIDPKARFVWLESPSACPKNALGFDFDGAAFTHVGERVTFEVLVASFGLEKDVGLARLSELVHTLDVGGTVVPEAVGFEALMAGARQRAKDDDALLADVSHALDSLYAYYAKPDKRSPG